jgi:glutaminyl-tRNA synthetase
MYTYAHPIEDAIEGITHSLCTLEFEDQRPFYDWLLATLDTPFKPQQIEFARLNLNYTVMSKRKLLRLVQEGLVSGWDDPRMPTIAGLRRRGYTPEAIRDFCDRIGLAKKENTIDVALLEHCVREDLNKRAPRMMAVLRPLRVVIENWPEGQVEQIEAVNNPEDASAGTRQLPFSGVIYIEQDDFREVPPPKYHRLSPGTEVRLRYAYIVKCVGVVKDAATGEVTELRCTYDPETLSGKGTQSGRRVKGTIHWVAAPGEDRAVTDPPEGGHHGAANGPARGEVRLYDRLFKGENPEDAPEGQDFLSNLNPDSLEVLRGCWLEPSLANLPAGTRVQFERLGYFVVDPDSTPGAPVFNRIVSLRDTWAKIERGSRLEA